MAEGPYVSEHCKLTWGGTAYNQNEIWQCGLHLTMGNAPGDTAKQTLIDAFTEFHRNTAAQTHHIRWIKWAPLDTQGHYRDPNAAVTMELDVYGAGVGYPNPQACLVVSLGGQNRLGPASHGRIYLPGPPYQVGNDGLLDASVCQATASNVVDLIKAINTCDGGKLGNVILASRQGKRQAAGMQPVTRVRVGRAVDTQRRRRNNLKESYIELPLG